MKLSFYVMIYFEESDRIMDNKLTDLQLKLKDYQRFISTLIILSSYLYMGAVINIYLQPTNNGITFIYLTIIAILSTTVLLYKYNQIKTDVEENEHV